MPECQKLKMYVRPGWPNGHLPLKQLNFIVFCIVLFCSALLSSFVNDAIQVHTVSVIASALQSVEHSRLAEFVACSERLQTCRQNLLSGIQQYLAFGDLCTKFFTR